MIFITSTFPENASPFKYCFSSIILFSHRCTLTLFHITVVFLFFISDLYLLHFITEIVTWFCSSQDNPSRWHSYCLIQQQFSYVILFDHSGCHYFPISQTSSFPFFLFEKWTLCLSHYQWLIDFYIPPYLLTSLHFLCHLFIFFNM